MLLRWRVVCQPPTFLLIARHEVTAAERRARRRMRLLTSSTSSQRALNLSSAACATYESSFCARVAVMKGKSPQPVAKCSAAWIASCGHLNVTSCRAAVEGGDEKGSAAEKNEDVVATLGITSRLGISELHQLTACDGLPERRDTVIMLMHIFYNIQKCSCCNQLVVNSATECS